MLRCANACELYRGMWSAIREHKYVRRVESSPACDGFTFEAKPGTTFELTNPLFNVVTERPIDRRWALANVLHFFAATEEAGVLRKYNARAGKYLTGDRWIGAYGAIAVPQIEQCIAALQLDPFTRAAVVQMGGPIPRDVNRPACWSHLHFLFGRYGLDLLVYQRSCNFTKVMPYDLVVLTNVLIRVAETLGRSVGSLFWTFGSLHSIEPNPAFESGSRNESILVPSDASRDTCFDALRNPEAYPWASSLLS